MPDVTLVTAPRRIIAAARDQTTLEAVARTIQPLLGRVWAFLKAHPGLRTDGHNIAIYRHDGATIRVEVGVEIVRECPETPEIVCSATPAGRAAMATHWGDYAKLGAFHAAVRAECKARGYDIVGPSWEVYGDWNDDWAKVRTDVYYLIKQ